MDGVRKTVNRGSQLGYLGFDNFRILDFIVTFG